MLFSFHSFLVSLVRNAHQFKIYFPLGGLLPRPPPEGLPVVLGPLGGVFFDMKVVSLFVMGTRDSVPVLNPINNSPVCAI